jgi:hypothetical protein
MARQSLSWRSSYRSQYRYAAAMRRDQALVQGLEPSRQAARPHLPRTSAPHHPRVRGVPPSCVRLPRRWHLDRRLGQHSARRPPRQARRQDQPDQSRHHAPRHRGSTSPAQPPQASSQRQRKLRRQPAGRPHQLDVQRRRRRRPRQHRCVRRLNAGEAGTIVIPQELPKWDKANGKPLLGLTRRRAAEVALFTGTKPTPAPPPQPKLTPGAPFSFRVTPNITYGELTLGEERRRFTNQGQCDIATELCAFIEKARTQFR